MKKIFIIGIGMGNPETITVRGKRIIEESQGLAGARRMVESYHRPGVEICRAIDPVEIYQWIRDREDLSRISVLMSGDVGFFSGAKKLSRLLEEEGYETELIPGISSLQYLCAKVKTPWEDVKIMSLHHHDNNFLGAVQSSEKVFLLTGGERTPGYICRALEDVGLGQVDVVIGENLSYPNERITGGPAEELGQEDYASLSVMLIENPDPLTKAVETHGIGDEEFIRGEVPMTKEEVRSVAISKLGIGKGDIVYDIGAGTGSVSVEMALQATEGRVYAIEVSGEALGLLGQNREKFGLFNLEIISGSAPEALEDLPPPDKVFIGGTKGKIKEILDHIGEVSPRARVVVDAIALESVAGALDALKAAGFNKVDTVQLSVARGKNVGSYTMMMGQNPVFIIRGEREDPDGESE
ncbi:MAG: precorrin-6y C5,15-methyltransferase (decarboxylating) subunit CbiE [Anaerovoracaceae bacterium]|jgi:precorrin-6Y C5,15-methyltransferase (decarboxylating)